MNKIELLDIGEVVERTGIPTTTLHLWERKDLITPAGRVGLRRQYAPEVIDRIAVIVVLQRSSFTLAEIRTLLADDAFADGKQVLEEKLASLRRLQADLAVAVNGLEHALACPNPNPLECDGFRAHLAGVLPTNRAGWPEGAVPDPRSDPTTGDETSRAEAP